MIKTRRINPLLNSFPAFEEAARAGSFTQAAKNLGMAQPSVSRFISNLEDNLDVALFDRHHNKVSLTPEGEQLFEAIKLGLGHIRLAIENIDSSATSNILTIRCSQGFAHQWFLPRRASLMAHLQGYEIHLATTGTHPDYMPRDNDIELLFGRGDWENKESFLLFDEVVFAVCSPAFALHNDLVNKELDLASIQDLQLLTQDRGEKGWMNWQSWFNHFGGNFQFPKNQYMFNDYALTLQAAMEGKGIALGWDRLMDSHLSNNWLVTLNGMKVRSGKGYYLVFSPSNPVANELRKWAVEMVLSD